MILGLEMILLALELVVCSLFIFGKVRGCKFKVFSVG
jgi:hypothetical protein